MPRTESLTKTIKTGHVVLFGMVAITAALFLVPEGRRLAYPLILLSTMVHEMGHGLTALFLGGNFHSFQMFSDGSGVAQISGEFSPAAQALVAAGGLIGPAVGAAICFACAINGSLSRFALSAVGVFFIFCEILYVRNSFGLMFIGILAVICLWLAQQSQAWRAQMGLVFVAVQLSLSVFSRSDYLFTPTANTSAGPMPSDVMQIANALFPPYWFWGGLCGLFSLLVLAVGVWVYIKNS